VLHTLDRARAERQGALEPALRKITELLRRRGLIVLISDLYDEPERIQSAVGMLRHRGHDVIVFHVMDRSELDLDGEVGGLPLDEATSFEDLETGEKLPVITESVRTRYREMVQDHITTLRRLLTGARVDYEMFDTSQPLDNALFRYLSAREGMSRGSTRSGGGR
jgi:hypothetical protein